MKRNLICFIILMLSVNVLTAQQFKKVKVTLESGVLVEGKKGVLTSESLSCLVMDSPRTYSLSDVQLIQAKKGKAGKWALGFGGGCATLVIVSGVVSGTDGIAAVGGTTGSYILGGVLWTGIFAGIGAGIGALIDDWETVYIRQAASRLKNFDLHVSSNELAKYNLTLRYTIPIQ